MNHEIPRRTFLKGTVAGLCAGAAGTLAMSQPVGNPSETERIRTQKAKGFVQYRDFGAKGDGKTDDLEAIRAAHAFANEHRLPVKADEGATYYIGGANLTAEIMTDTDFGKAAFILDDTEVKNRGQNIFVVASTQKPFKPEGITSLKKGQDKIGLTLQGNALVTVTNAKVKRYIRFGANQNSGAAQTDIFQVDSKGGVDPQTPIIWDFDEITDISVLPIDETPLRITGGLFTTIANQAEPKVGYYNRGLAIRRSNVTVEGLEHRVTDEGQTGAPYNGFIHIGTCAWVKILGCQFTGRKVTAQGTYDIVINKAVNISFVHCAQTNDIHDNRYWGIMGSNFCKNLMYDHCKFSRFDAHMGVANATIRNSILGHMGINAIGSGTFTLENSTVCGRNLINLRSDYGSVWQGEFIIRDCVFRPSNGKPVRASLFGGSNSGQHDFGYPCHMPERITIHNLEIDDAQHPSGYDGPALFADFNPKQVDESYVERFPFTVTREVVLKNVRTASGKDIRVSENPFMFRNVKIVQES
jgi:hypothetical protein